MGKAFEKQIKTIEDQGGKKNVLKDLKTKEQTKAITYKSNDDKTSTIKETYDEILERLDEILKMRKEISRDDLFYDFKGSTDSINFCKYGGPVYVYGHMKNGEKTLQQVVKEQKRI